MAWGSIDLYDVLQARISYMVHNWYVLVSGWASMLRAHGLE